MRFWYGRVPIALLLAIWSAGQSWAARGAESSGSRLSLTQGWELQSSAYVHDSGETVSTSSYRPAGWLPTDVPSTVLAALVRDGKYRDPYFGNNLASIPGTDYLSSWMSAKSEGENLSNMETSPDSPFRPAWWYRTEFRLPEEWRSKKIWLHFDGINYRGNIWVNGHKVAGAEKIAGTYRLYRFDITGLVHRDGGNVVAVEVFPPRPEDLAITWVDWNPTPPDKAMGLWRPVYVTATGPVVLKNPQVVTRFDLPSLAVAHLSIRVAVQNTSSAPIEGLLKGHIGDISFYQKVHLDAGEARDVSFDPSDFSQLNLRNPQVWWPVDLGPHDLYSLDLEFEADKQVSDRQTIQFGVRQVTSQIDKHGDIQFFINGKPILIRGAGWAPDMMLRDDPERMEAELRYVRDMHLNTIRLEGKIETDPFFELCDRYGILVMAGWSCCDQWEMWDRWNDEDYTVAASSLRDQLSRLQNHPSVIDWLYGSDKAPPPRVEQMYLNVLRDSHWPNPFQNTSDATPGINGLAGFKGHVDGHWGPYDYVPPSYWLLDHTHGGAWGFNTETSPGPAIPPLESLRKFLPGDKLWPMNDNWVFHADGEVCRQGLLETYRKAQEARYGAPKNLQDFLRKSQVMDYESERAMFEAYGRNKPVSTGVIQWMLNNAWPSVVWHLYDYYLNPGGGYFGTKKACEPLHVQYSYDDDSVVVVNSFYHGFSKMRIQAELLDLNLKQRFSKSVVADIPADSSTRIFILPKIERLTNTYFVKLTLRNTQGSVESSNFYWLSVKPDRFDWNGTSGYTTPVLSYSDLTELNQLPKASVTLEKASVKDRGDEETASVTVKNPGSTLAFFIHVRAVKGNGGPDVLPIIWTDNDFELLPGESRELTATYSHKMLGDSQLLLVADGWNVTPVVQAVSAR